MEKKPKGPKATEARRPHLAMSAVRSRRSSRCDLWTAYEWRFNLVQDQRLANAEELGKSECQGNEIRRVMYTLSGRKGEFRLCRRHQVEVGSMKRPPTP